MTENEIVEARAQEFYERLKKRSPDVAEVEYIKAAYISGYGTGMLRGARIQRKALATIGRAPEDDSKAEPT